MNKFMAATLVFLASISSAFCATPFYSNQSYSNDDGQLYMQTNEVTNELIHYVRGKDGQLTERHRIATGGMGSGTFKPITGQTDAPNAFESVGSVLLTPDHHYLFVTNGGDNTVSSFGIDKSGKPELIDFQWTGQPVDAKSGTAKSLTYSPDTQTLYVGHAYGPDHIHLFSVCDGHLILRKEHYSLNTREKKDRVISQITLSPNGKFLLADVLFDKRPGTNADGSADLEVSNTTDKNALGVFAVESDGSLSHRTLQDGGGAAPFVISFLHGSDNTFIQGLAVGDGALVGHLDSHGVVTNSSVTPIDTHLGKISELCWLAISPDNSRVLATVLAYGYVTSFSLKDGVLKVAQDPAAPAVPGDGTFQAINGDLTSSPIDNWLSPDGRYFYQIYPNASKLVAYELDQQGHLQEIQEQVIPRNTPIGLAGY